MIKICVDKPTGFMVRLKELRTEKKLTQKELSAYLSYGSSAISNYERGHNTPSIPDLIRISKVFQVSVDYLVGNSNQRQTLCNENIKEFLGMYMLYDKRQLELLRRYMLCLNGCTTNAVEVEKKRLPLEKSN